MSPRANALADVFAGGGVAMVLLAVAVLVLFALGAFASIAIRKARRDRRRP